MPAGFIRALALRYSMRYSPGASPVFFTAAVIAGDNPRALPLEASAVVFNLGLGHNSRSASFGWAPNINLQRC